MPRAGWCRECGRWVWVDENGVCQNGHASDCVESVHDVVEPAPAAIMGEGEFPEALNAFNWGAYLLPVLWGAAYGVWPLIGAWALALLSSLLMASMVPMINEAPELRPYIMASIGTSVVASAAKLWAGYRANRLAWRRNAIIGQLSEELAARRQPVEMFVARQRTWAIVGWVVILGGTLLILPAVYMEWQQYEMGAVEVVRQLVWLLAEVGAAWWLAIKMRDGGTMGEPEQDEQRSPY